MQDQLQRRTALLPRQHLADGGYMNFASVERSAARGIEVFSPPRENRDFHIDPLTPQPRDSPALAAYRLRMASAEGKEIYKERVSTAETVNAGLKHLARLPSLHQRSRRRENSHPRGRRTQPPAPARHIAAEPVRGSTRIRLRRRARQQPHRFGIAAGGRVPIRALSYFSPIFHRLWKRAGANGATSTGGLRPTIRSAISSPVIADSSMPLRKWPVA